MITITGLLARQIELLNIMWSINDPEQYDIWKCSLPLDVMNEVDSLETLLILETLDTMPQDLTDAKNVLSKFALKG
jgi:hypothetical protein